MESTDAGRFFDDALYRFEDQSYYEYPDPDCDIFWDEEEPYADLEQEAMEKSAARDRKVTRANPYGWVDGAGVRTLVRLQQERDRGERT